MLLAAGHTWPLPWSVAEIGRADPRQGIAPELDLTALDPDRSVSRQHARLARTPNGRYLLRDLGSANGTWVGDKKLTPDEDHIVADEVILRIGDVSLTFRLAQPWPPGLVPLWSAPPSEDVFDPTRTHQGRREFVQPVAPASIAQRSRWTRWWHKPRRRSD